MLHVPLAVVQLPTSVYHAPSEVYYRQDHVLHVLLGNTHIQLFLTTQLPLVRTVQPTAVLA